MGVVKTVTQLLNIRVISTHKYGKRISNSCSRTAFCRDPLSTLASNPRPPLNISSSALRRMMRISSSESPVMPLGSRVTSTRLTLRPTKNYGIKLVGSQSDFCDYFDYFDYFDYLSIYNK